MSSQERMRHGLAEAAEMGAEEEVRAHEAGSPYLAPVDGLIPKR